MTTGNFQPRSSVVNLLKIRKGSRTAPFLLLLLVVCIFVTAFLPGGLDQLAENLGLDFAKKPDAEFAHLVASLPEPTEKSMTGMSSVKFVSAFAAADNRATAWCKIQDLGIGGTVSKVGVPVVKVFVEELFGDFGKILYSLFKSSWQFALLALVPGIAGLIYRRNFIAWFAVSFAVLFLINARGYFGEANKADVSMPFSGAVLFFIVSQILLMLLANRLRRSTSNHAFFGIDPRLHNGVLAVFLVFVALACFAGWGPGRYVLPPPHLPTPAGVRSAVPAPVAAPAATRTSPQDTQVTRLFAELFTLPPCASGRPIDVAVTAAPAGAPPVVPASPPPTATADSGTPGAAPTQPGAPATPPANTSSGTGGNSTSSTPATPAGSATTGAAPTRADGPRSATAAPTKPQPRRSWIWSFLGTGPLAWLYRLEFILIGLPLVYALLRVSRNIAGREPKNIVVCLDGTSNTPEQYELGLLAQTNVYKLFDMLKADKTGSFKDTFVPKGHFDASLCRKYGDKQIGLYYTGVGNTYDNDPVAQLLGMATGLGATGVVEKAYLDIVRTYRPGDRVFIVGFSRGAATARLLARAIHDRGAPRSVWTLRLLGRHWTVRSAKHGQIKVPIEVLGCWDTVGSFGIAKTIWGFNFQQFNLGKDLTVPETVHRAYHMLALDERRDSFEPTLMDPDPIKPERITEVWFTGDHANVGGGWATDRLSDVTLDFLLTRISNGYSSDPQKVGAEDWGLYLNAYKGKKELGHDHIDLALLKGAAGKDDKHTPEWVRVIEPDPLGQLRSWQSILYSPLIRKLPLYAVISDTVFQRMREALPVYAPDSLFKHNEELANKRGEVERALEHLVHTNSIKPEDRDAAMKLNEKLRLIKWSDYEASIAEILATAEKDRKEPPAERLRHEQPRAAA